MAKDLSELTRYIAEKTGDKKEPSGKNWPHCGKASGQFLKLIVADKKLFLSATNNSIRLKERFSRT